MRKYLPGLCLRKCSAEGEAEDVDGWARFNTVVVIFGGLRVERGQRIRDRTRLDHMFNSVVTCSDDLLTTACHKAPFTRNMDRKDCSRYKMLVVYCAHFSLLSKYPCLQIMTKDI